MIEMLFTGIGNPDVVLTVNRVALGLAFAISGYHKTFFPARHTALIGTMEYAKIPAPTFMAWFVCIIEFLAGLGLVFGVLSALSALGVVILSLVATCTVEIWTIKDMKPSDLLDWVDDVFWLPAVLFIIMGLVVIFAGPGYGLDSYIVAMIL